MSNIVVSIAMRKNVVAFLIIEDNIIKTKITEYIKDERALQSSYTCMIYAFKLALRYVRQYIQVNKSTRDVCFEISNSTFIKWIDNQYSKEAYQEEFNEALKLLQELPIRYAFSYAQRPKALPFADDKYCEKKTLSGLNLEEYSK
jgi:hypothetical protein